MLSDVDIVKQLGKNIYIYPFKEENLKGASYNLTASAMAWSITDRDNIVEDKKIKIKPHDTGLIYTNEIVCITKTIAGTFHSRVNNVSHGCGHIGTTLNPGWFGRLLISITNHTDKTIDIDVNSSFVTLIFYYLNHKSTNDQDDNTNSRLDILNEVQIKLTNDESKVLTEDDTQTIKALAKKISDEKTYEKIKRTKKIQKSKLFIGALILLLIISILRLFCKSIIQIDIIKELFTIVMTFLTTYILGNIFRNKE